MGKMWQWIIASCLWKLSLGQDSHSCVYDLFPKTPYTNMAQTYSGNTFAPIRIFPYFAYANSSLSSTNPSLLNHIQQNLFPAAISWLSNTLSVIPVQNKLYLSKQCTSGTTGSTGTFVCNSYTDSICGPRSVPSSHEWTVCGNNCNVLNNGSGIPNADIVIYVYAQTSPSCLANTLAYSGICQVDQSNRTIGGFINFCTANLPIPNTIMTWNLQVSALVHELSHILGYSADSFIGHSTTNAKVGAFNERGMQVNKIISPKAIKEASNYFSCPTINGVELESQGGNAIGGISSHLEKRIYFNDFMTGVLMASSPSAYSRISLAVFDDLGVYSVNYSQATPFYFGKGKTCPFVLGKCLQGTSSTPSDPTSFCNSLTTGCTSDLNAVATCNPTTYGSALPVQYQYFPLNPDEGGSIIYMDYCPAMTATSVGNAYTDCRFAANAPSTYMATGETYGPSSRCVISNVIDTESGVQSSSNGRCAQITCQENVLGVMYLSVTIGGAVVNCGTTGGQTYNLPSTSTFAGSVTCPLVSEVCPSTCKNQCLNWGSCGANSTCACPPGFSGSDCSTPKLATTSIPDVPISEAVQHQKKEKGIILGWMMMMIPVLFFELIF